jgi:branched-chain amino acid transport system ATP-binding protein
MSLLAHPRIDPADAGFRRTPAARSIRPAWTSAPAATAGPLLDVRDLTVKFGGIVALDGVSLSVDAGQIVGLIGPNGAGKTTCLNCISRLYTPIGGHIEFGSRTILSATSRGVFKLAPHAVAGLGIGRTFQNVALFPSMSVLQNVMVGVHSRTRSAYLGHALALPSARREDRKIRETAMEVIEFLDLRPVALQPAGALPFGTLKRVELARALASRPRLLLLDEPAVGLNHQEVEAVAELIRGIRDHRHTSVLLVEHHMGLVMSVSDKVVVLDFGRNIAEGPPDAIQRHADVIRAYLGSEP